MFGNNNNMYKLLILLAVFAAFSFIFIWAKLSLLAIFCTVGGVAVIVLIIAGIFMETFGIFGRDVEETGNFSAGAMDTKTLTAVPSAKFPTTTKTEPKRKPTQVYLVNREKLGDKSSQLSTWDIIQSEAQNSIEKVNYNKQLGN
jgi:hypothetical protein